MKLVGVVGGSIGMEPFGRRTWSGSSVYFFSALKQRGALHRALGVEPGFIRRHALMAKTFRLSRTQWRKAFFMDCTYRDAATKVLSESLSNEDLKHPVLQIGAMFSAPKAVHGRTRCFSYHDGNLAIALNHDATIKAMSAGTVQAALRYEEDLYRNLDMIFTTSDYLRDSFVRDFGIASDRIVTVRAGVNLDSIPPPQNVKDYDRKCVLFVGVDFERKGGWNVLKAFRALHEKHSDAVLHIVGPHTLVLPTDLSKGVTYYGYLDKADGRQLEMLRELFRQATIFVMPSLYEPLGVAPLEAMAYSVPCIVTGRWAFKELVQPGINGALVEPDDVDDLYEKMSLLLDDPEGLKRMGERGREFVLSTYTWDHSARRLITAVRKAFGAV